MTKHQALVPSNIKDKKQEPNIVNSIQNVKTNKYGISGSLHDSLQCLNISSETRKTDEDTIVDLGDSLEVSGDCL